MIEFDVTYAPVVPYTILRCFLTAAAYHNLSVRPIDIKTAFPHGKLEEDVQMSKHEGYVNTKEPDKFRKPYTCLNKQLGTGTQRLANLLVN